jgi:hypothetical protein
MSKLLPPALDRGARELRGVTADSDRDPALVGRQVIDPVGDRLAFGVDVSTLYLLVPGIMVSNVLPGLRELRAPLAAGYLWLTVLWLIFGASLPTRTEVKSSPLERLHELGPLVSDIGRAVIVSVAAYLVGSVAIDAQRSLLTLGRLDAFRSVISSFGNGARLSRGAEDALESVVADAPEAHRWYVMRAVRVIRRLDQRPELRDFLIARLQSLLVPESKGSLRDPAATGLSEDEIERYETRLNKLVRGNVMAEWLWAAGLERFVPALSNPYVHFGAQAVSVFFNPGDERQNMIVYEPDNVTYITHDRSSSSDVSADGGGAELVPATGHVGDSVPEMEHAVENGVGNLEPVLRQLPSITEPARAWIDENRDVVKVRLLDLSPALHSEVDRPDAEATFRMALWPPLVTMLLYLSFAHSWLWMLGLVLPIALVLQWLVLRRTANDALVTAVAANPETRGMLIAGAFGIHEEPRSVALEDSAAGELR